MQITLTVDGQTARGDVPVASREHFAAAALELYDALCGSGTPVNLWSTTTTAALPDGGTQRAICDALWRIYPGAWATADLLTATGTGAGLESGTLTAAIGRTVDAGLVENVNENGWRDVYRLTEDGARLYREVHRAVERSRE